MGMFDTIKNRLYCPYCGNKQKSNSFQTKDFKRHMISIDVFKIKDVYYNFYTECSHCKTWISIEVNPDYGDTKRINKRR